MKTDENRRSRRSRIALLGLAASAAMAPACLSRPLEPVDPRTTSTVIEKLTQSGVDKIDLLLVVDNSSSMADKQAILALAVPDLIVDLVNPMCLDKDGKPIMRPSGPLAKCDPGLEREFEPVLDIHIGMLSSSLGTFGADGCPDTHATQSCGNGPSSANDHGHLLTRTNACTGGDVMTYDSLGFLAWDPAQKETPHGEMVIGDVMKPGIVKSLHDLVLGDGQAGCGFEQQNESWYRFLVDPAPYQQIGLNSKGSVITQGVDKALLKQRSDFLRSDSLLAIINVTDETDVSIKESANFPEFALYAGSGGQKYHHLPHARGECAKDPNDPCCRSCIADQSGCPADAACAAKPYFDDSDEDARIRAFGLGTHKASYGTEYMYPPSRYVGALKNPSVPNAQGVMVANPIFSNLDPNNGASIRDPSLVFYAAITGVPWQLIARQDAQGKPDLLKGLDTSDPKNPVVAGGFKTGKELDVKDADGNTVWDYIVGDPEKYVPPKSPFMQESSKPRSGIDPITKTAISAPAPPGSPRNDLNGHEWTIAEPAADIQYACIFDLPKAISCTGDVPCDCGDGTDLSNPLCDPNPDDLDPKTNLPKNTLQKRAKAYPGIKHLAIAKGMGDQGIAASICAKQLDMDPQSMASADWGYRPAVQAIVDRLKTKLHNQCLPRSLTPDATTKQVPCVIIAAKTTNSCNCNVPGRKPVATEHEQAVAAAQADALNATNHWNCFCEITQTTGGAKDACENDPSTTPMIPGSSPPQQADGWCYIDGTTTPTIGNAKLVETCDASEKREVRFVGAGKGDPTEKATLFITCAGDNSN